VRGQIKSPQNGDSDSLNILKDIRVCKSQDLESFGLKKPLPHRVSLFGFAVILTVEFDNQSRSKTGKVCDVVAD